MLAHLTFLKNRRWILASAFLIAGFGAWSRAQDKDSKAAVKPALEEKQVMGSTVVDWTSMEVKKSAKGESRRVFRAPTATLDELEYHITTLNPGEMAHPAHQHPDEELIIVKEGTVESLVNGELKRVGPGSVIFQAANQLHSIKNVGEGPATYHVIKWNSPGMLAKTRAEKAKTKAKTEVK